MSPQTLDYLWSRYLEVRGEPGELRENRGSSAAVEESKHRANQLKNRLLLNYSPLVKYVAGRISARMTEATDPEELISWGVVGLLDAVESFDPERGVKFETYAISKIRWAILDELRKEDRLTRRMRLRAQEAERARASLAQTLRRAPNEEEVAEELGVSVPDHRNFLQHYLQAQVGSLEARLEAGDGTAIAAERQVTDETAIDPQAAAADEDRRAKIIEALDDLDDRERLVATLYFYEGLTLKEIGKAMELSEGRISQLLSGALAKLRGILTPGAVA